MENMNNHSNEETEMQTFVPPEKAVHYGFKSAKPYQTLSHSGNGTQRKNLGTIVTEPTRNLLK